MSHPSVFGEGYADYYDLTYADKDYDSECDFIVEAMERFLSGPSERVLDLGCGTGQHAVRLAELGLDVTGVDMSEAMLAKARRRAEESGVVVKFLRGDIRDVDVDGPFDVALMMFAVLGYFHTNDDVLAALANTRRHLKEGGLLLFDVWYGPGVLSIGPEPRTRVITVGEVTITRRSLATVDSYSQVCDVDISLASRGDEGPGETVHEVHRMRYFFANELALLLSVSGYELVQLSAFPELGTPVGPDSWNVLGIARAVEP